MLTDLRQANYFWVVLSLFITILANLSRAYRWGMLIEPLGLKPHTANLFHSLNIGYFANLAAPRLGEVTRCTALFEVEKVPLDKLVGTVIAERIIDLLSLLSLMVLVILLSVDRFSNFFWDSILKEKVKNILNTPVLNLFILAVIIAVIVGLLFFFRTKILRLSFIKKVIGFIKGIGEGLRTIMTMKKKGWFLFHTVAIWALYFFSGFVCLFAIPETAHLDLVAALFLLVLGGIGMSAPVQGGIGAYHIIIQSGMVFLGVAADKGLVYATIVHSSQLLFIALMGIIALLFLNIEKRKQLAKTNQ